METLRYNGKTILEIESQLPANNTDVEKDIYLKNCLEIAKNDVDGVNKDLNELIRNSNFNIINNCLTR